MPSQCMCYSCREARAQGAMPTFEDDFYFDVTEDDDDYSDRGSGRLEYYSYRPDLVFHGQGPAFYGMEIEVSTDYPNRAAAVVARHCGSDLAYCKEDGSVDGLEIVTHPMSYDWAMSQFPWDMLTDLADRDCYIVASDNGIHVHVSRDAFGCPSHLYRWMKFVYRNQDDVQRIARRRTAHWAQFNADVRKGQINHVKMGRDFARRENEVYNRVTGQWEHADPTRLSRYNAINTVNESTLEVRVFASTLNITEAKSALQLVAGSVEYTRSLDASKVLKGRAWDWGAFQAWLAAQDGKYAALEAVDSRRQ